VRARMKMMTEQDSTEGTVINKGGTGVGRFSHGREKCVRVHEWAGYWKRKAIASK
jgi:hypothetical protein